MVLTHCVARTRGALQPAAPRTMRSRAAGAFHSTFANRINFAIIIIIIIIILDMIIIIVTITFIIIIVIIRGSSHYATCMPLPSDTFHHNIWGRR